MGSNPGAVPTNCWCKIASINLDGKIKDYPNGAKPKTQQANFNANGRATASETRDRQFDSGMVTYLEGLSSRYKRL